MKPSRLGTLQIVGYVLLSLACGSASSAGRKAGVHEPSVNVASDGKPPEEKPVDATMVNPGGWLPNGKRLLLTSAGLVTVDPESTPPGRMTIVHEDARELKFVEGSQYHMVATRVGKWLLFDATKAVPVESVGTIPRGWDGTRVLSSRTGRTILTLMSREGGDEFGRIFQGERKEQLRISLPPSYVSDDRIVRLTEGHVALLDFNGKAREGFAADTLCDGREASPAGLWVRLGDAPGTVGWLDFDQHKIRFKMTIARNATTCLRGQPYVAMRDGRMIRVFRTDDGSAAVEWELKEPKSDIKSTWDQNTSLLLPKRVVDSRGSACLLQGSGMPMPALPMDACNVSGALRADGKFVFATTQDLGVGLFDVKAQVFVWKMAAQPGRDRDVELDNVEADPP